MAENTRVHAFITGRVQGVAFRWETQRVAEQHQVRGWVRNLPDRRVEAVFEGPRPQVEAVLEWCHQGPGIARVDAVDVQWEDFKGEFEGFSITY
ncbi:MAG: acylphosphatase [Desulfobacterales bacterium]|nr:acylphosphatase [Desulfobacterales bacterium]